MHFLFGTLNTRETHVKLDDDNKGYFVSEFGFGIWIYSVNKQINKQKMILKLRFSQKQKRKRDHIVIPHPHPSFFSIVQYNIELNYR